MIEVWKDITEYPQQIKGTVVKRYFEPGKYQISIYGKVRCKDKELKPQNDGKEYVRFDLWDVDGKRVHCKQHRLIALAFLPNPENKLEVNHIDGNRSNNSITNLEWVSHQENQEHKKLKNKLFEMMNENFLPGMEMQITDLIKNKPYKKGV